MKVLHVLESSVPELIGYTIRGRYIVQHQKQLGLQPMVVTSPFFRGAQGERTDTIDGVRYFRSNHIARPDRAKGRLAAYWTRYRMVRRYGDYVTELVRRERPDIIHAHSSYTNGLAAGRASRATGVPYIYELRTLWGEAAVVEEGLKPGSLTYRVIGSLEGRVMRRAHRLVVISQGIRDAIVAAGIDPAKIDAIPNGVDTAIFQPRPPDAELRARLGLEGAFVVGFIGSLRRLEGLPLLVEAFARLRARVPRTRLIIVGDGQDKERLEQQAQALDCADAVTCTGLVPHDDVLRYYSVMDVLAYPRIEARINETVTPLKPLEAMAMAKVCVGSDVGGLRELIADRTTGLLFRRGDAADLALKLEQLAVDAGLYAGLAQQSLATVRAEREWSVIAARYPAIYERAIATAAR